jgi:hypothetical protein
VEAGTKPDKLRHILVIATASQQVLQTFFFFEKGAADLGAYLCAIQLSFEVESLQYFTIIIHVSYSQLSKS